MIHRHLDLAPQAILVLLMIVAVALTWTTSAETSAEATPRVQPGAVLSR